MEHLQRSGLLLNHGILGSQLWGSFARNQWVNWPSNGTPHSEVWGNNTNGSFTRFYVPTAAGAEYQPTNNFVDNVINPGSSPMSQPINTSTQLAESYVCANPELYDDIEEYCDNIGYMIIPVINDTTSTNSDIEVQSRWNRNYSIYKLLKSDTTAYSETLAALDSFVVANDSTEIGLLYKAEKSVANMLNKKVGDLEDEISFCESISTTTVMGSILKTSFYYALLLQNEQRVPTTSETEILDSIARSCPLIYGQGVSVARALISAFDSIYTDRINLCEIPVESTFRIEDSQSQNSSNGINLNVELYPNPSKGILTLEASSETLGTLIGLDLTGRKIFNNCQVWFGKTEINISEIPNGAYVFRFNSINNSKQWKIVISR